MWRRWCCRCSRWMRSGWPNLLARQSGRLDSDWATSLSDRIRHEFRNVDQCRPVSRIQLYTLGSKVGKDQPGVDRGWETCAANCVPCHERSGSLDLPLWSVSR